MDRAESKQSTNTLYISGLPTGVNARELAADFEKFGKLKRCDIPVPPVPNPRTLFAFVEYINDEDASKAYQDLQGLRVKGVEVTIQWARQQPLRKDMSRVRRGRYDARDRPPERRRSRSPYRRDPRDVRMREPYGGGGRPYNNSSRYGSERQSPIDRYESRPRDYPVDPIPPREDDMRPAVDRETGWN